MPAGDAQKHTVDMSRIAVADCSDDLADLQEVLMGHEEPAQTHAVDLGLIAVAMGNTEDDTSDLAEVLMSTTPTA